jgi:hypothetical protein
VDKHSSLLRKIENYGEKSFITLDPGGWEKLAADLSKLIRDIVKFEQ